MVERTVIRLPLTPLMLLPTLPAVSLVRVARSSEVRISIRYVRVGERKGEGEGEGGSEVVGNSRPGPGPGSVLLLAQAAPARVISDVRGVATFKLADGRQGSPKWLLVAPGTTGAAR